MSVLFSTRIVSRKSMKIDKFVRCTIVIDYRRGRSSFYLAMHYVPYTVLLQ